jgi:hypothetical protein
MKFVTTWTPRQGGSPSEFEDAAKRALAVFSKWSPPADQTFKEFVQRVDGNGGFAVVETDNIASLLESAEKFAPWFVFETYPVIDMMEAVPTFNEAIEFRDSIS